MNFVTAFALPLLPGFAYSIHATWGTPLSRALYMSRVLLLHPADISTSLFFRRQLAISCPQRNMHFPPLTISLRFHPSFVREEERHVHFQFHPTSSSPLLSDRPKCVFSTEKRHHCLMFLLNGNLLSSSLVPPDESLLGPSAARRRRRRCQS